MSAYLFRNGKFFTLGYPPLKRPSSTIAKRKGGISFMSSILSLSSCPFFFLFFLRNPVSRKKKERSSAMKRRGRMFFLLLFLLLLLPFFISDVTGKHSKRQLNYVIRVRSQAELEGLFTHESRNVLLFISQQRYIN